MRTTLHIRGFVSIGSEIVAALAFGLLLTMNRSGSAGQGKGGEIKPKPSASPTPRQPARVAPKPPRVTAPVAVRVAKVIEQTFAETLNATGVLSAAETVSVQAKVSGMLAKISVQ